MLKINGHSDDIVYAEVNGKTIDEFYPLDRGSFLRFPDGTVVRCQFCPISNPKGWDFDVVRNPNAHAVIRKIDTKDPNDYCLEFTSWNPPAIAWMNNTPDGPDEQELDDLNEGDHIADDFRNASYTTKLKIWKLLNE